MVKHSFSYQRDSFLGRYTYFHKCEHGKLKKKRKWLKSSSAAFKALSLVIEDKKILSDLDHLSQFRHTGNLEVYHSVINKYCPKRLHFSLNGMIARTQLAVLDFNDGMNNEQAIQGNGDPSYKQHFSRITQTWVVKKVMKKRNRSYLQDLLLLTLDMTPNDNDLFLPLLGEIPQNIATKEKPDKSTAIANMKSRFK